MNVFTLAVAGVICLKSGGTAEVGVAAPTPPPSERTTDGSLAARANTPVNRANATATSEYNG